MRQLEAVYRVYAAWNEPRFTDVLAELSNDIVHNAATGRGSPLGSYSRVLLENPGPRTADAHGGSRPATG